MLWLISQIAISLLVTAVLAATIGFWVRGWLIADQRTLEHIKWERQLEKSEDTHQQLVEESSELGARLEELKQDYQEALANERKLYDQLDDMREQLRQALKAKIDETETTDQVSTEDATSEAIGVEPAGTVPVEDSSFSESGSAKDALAEEKLSEEKTKSESISDKDSDQRDNLRRIRGIGPKLARKLNQQGFYQYRQLANLDEDGIDALAEKLRVYPGRIRKDRWIEQASNLLKQASGR